MILPVHFVILLFSYKNSFTPRAGNFQLFFDNFAVNSHLKEKGVDISSLIEEWTKKPVAQKQETFKKIKNSLRQMSYRHTVDTRVETKKAMLQAWVQDRTANPTQSHLMLAFTSRDACSLNESARELMKAKGEIGARFYFPIQQIHRDDFSKETVMLENKTFAKGDRLLFMRNDNALKVKKGSLGTIVAIDKRKITVLLDDSGERLVSFAPKLYPFIDNGWATNIHKAQGVTVDHVKLLGAFEEYRNLAYVAMSRHRESLKVFCSQLDFWREDKIIDRLSRIQEKLSGVDYLNADQIQERLKSDSKILWHEKKLQQGRDLLNAVKVTARSAVDQIFSSAPNKAPSQPILDLKDSEEKRSAEIFKSRESLPKSGRL